MRPGAVAFITGGGRGIGRAIGLTFARAGASVVLAARTLTQVDAAAEDIRREGGEAAGVVCDVTSAESVRAAHAAAVDRFGRVDILVNNAGIVTSARFTKTDEALWQRTLEVNLTGTYRCTWVALPSMVERGFGRVINVASIAGKVGHPYTTAYCASKHGVVGFTRALALEVARRGVTVNAICPGFVDTEMTADTIATIVGVTGRQAADVRATLEALSPQQRLMTAGEVAAIALFLAGDEAYGINGQAINLDGGLVTS